MFEETVSVLRFVNCAECGFDEGIDMDVAVYGYVEVGDWVCPNCQSYYEYRHDTAWDRADEAYDRDNETW
jgi:hypothetical protein